MPAVAHQVRGLGGADVEHVQLGAGRHVLLAPGGEVVDNQHAVARPRPGPSATWEPMKPAPPVTQTVRDVMARSPLRARPGRPGAARAAILPARRPRTSPATCSASCWCAAPRGARGGAPRRGRGVPRASSDPACHTFRGRRTARVEAMWGEAGQALRLLHLRDALLRQRGDARGRGAGGGAAARRVPRRGGRRCCARRAAGPTGTGSSTVPRSSVRGWGSTATLNGADLTPATARSGWPTTACGVPGGGAGRLPRVGVAYAGEAAAWPLRFRRRPGGAWPRRR